MNDQLPLPTIVADARALERLLAELEGASEIAVDTEADSFFNFREKVCLVQLSAGERDWLVDPLAGFDLAPLGRVFADPRCTKVFHDGEYDISILKRDYRFEFKNLFDTRVAASALGEESPGLAAVLKARFGIELDKSLQRSNWSMRPLSQQQILYARLDTRFLSALAREQRAELARRGRTMIVEGECQRLEALVPPEPVFAPDEFVRIKGARALDPHAQSRLRELFVTRFELARASDLPPFKIIGNDSLTEIAKAAPRNFDELQRVPGLSPKQAHRIGGALLAALERARAAGPLTHRPVSQRRDGESSLSELEFELHERLKHWRKTRAQQEGYDSALVLNRHAMLRLAQRKPRNLQELARIEGLQAWQLESFGVELVAVIERALRELDRQPLRRGFRSRGS